MLIIPHTTLWLRNMLIHTCASSLAQREAVVEKFRLGKTWVLIATDIMSRGMDFKGIACVINYDFPQSTLSYVHRIGRPSLTRNRK